MKEKKSLNISMVGNEGNLGLSSDPKTYWGWK
jgi:hypothetical protein